MVTLKIENNIAWVTLTRPNKQNALNFSMFVELDNIVTQLQKNREIRAVILRGAGGNFCAGLDVKSVTNKPSTIFKLLFKWLPGDANLVQRVSLNWRKLPVPVISLIEGNCLGAGLHIALGTDYRIAKKDAQIAIMESKWGLCPDMGTTHLLTSLINQDQLLLLASQGTPISSTKARDLGLISDVQDDLLEAAHHLLDTLLIRSPDALAAIKKNQQHCLPDKPA